MNTFSTSTCWLLASKCDEDAVNPFIGETGTFRCPDEKSHWISEIRPCEDFEQETVPFYFHSHSRDISKLNTDRVVVAVGQVLSDALKFAVQSHGPRFGFYSTQLLTAPVNKRKSMQSIGKDLKAQLSPIFPVRFRYRDQVVCIEERIVIDSAGDRQKVFSSFFIWSPQSTLDNSAIYQTLMRLINAMQEFAMEHFVADPFAPGLYTVNNGYWQNLKRLEPRKLSTVFLPDNTRERILHDITSFQEIRRPKLIEHGFPAKRFYLLYGPPGTGKTSLVRSIASHYQLHIAMFTFTDDLTVEIAERLMQNLPEKAIILLEDIDRVTKSIDFQACMLKILDGVYNRKQDVQLLFATTNHPETVNDALLRHGRFDMHVEIPFPVKEQVQDAFRQLFNVTDPKDPTVHIVARKFAPYQGDMPMSTVMEAYSRVIHLSAKEAADQIDFKAMHNETRNIRRKTDDNMIIT